MLNLRIESFTHSSSICSRQKEARKREKERKSKKRMRVGLVEFGKIGKKAGYINKPQTMTCSEREREREREWRSARHRCGQRKRQ